jgi:hypothetical protein
MTREAIIEKTLQVINQLPQEMATEVSDFADFIAKKYEEQLLTQNIQLLVEENTVFDFLANEEEIYSTADLVT